MRLSSRVRALAESATLGVQRASAELREKGVDVIDLGVGEPDLATPQPIIEATIEALRQGFTKYTPAIGIPELRDAIAEQYRARYGGSWQRDNVAVTIGAKQALYNVFMAILDEGDEVVLPTPCWVSFPEQIRLAGGTPRYVETTVETGFVPDVAALAEAVTDRTRAMVLCSPSNPTGTLIPRPVLRGLLQLAVERELYVVFDETYEQLVFAPDEHVSAAEEYASLGDRLIIVDTFSKTYAMTGMRLGYLVSSTELVRAVAKLQGHMTSNPTSIVQRGALAALRSAGAAVTEMRAEYRRRRDWFTPELAALDGFEIAPPQATFYVFPRVTGLMRKLGCESSAALAEMILREARVAVVPGEAFEAPGYIRLSFAASEAQLKEALQRLRALIAGS